MSSGADIPYARPIVPNGSGCTDTLPPAGASPPAITKSAGPSSVVAAQAFTQDPPARQRTDGFAVASAVCGITGIVPFVTQVIGLICGLVGLARIRRARRCGLPVRGVGWAVTGMISSGFVLLCWVVVFAGFALVSSTFAETTESLGGVLKTSP